jgi:hypothetical protein
MIDPATLAILVGSSGALVAIVRGLRDWLFRRNTSQIIITRRDGTKISVQNISLGDANTVIQALTRDLESKSAAKSRERPDIVVESEPPEAEDK